MTTTETPVHSFELRFSGPAKLTIKKLGEPERIIEIDVTKVLHSVQIDAAMFDYLKTCSPQQFASIAIDPCANALVRGLAGVVAQKMADIE